MTYALKNLKREAGNLPIPQYFNTVADDFEPLQGVNGAGRVLLYDASGNPLLTSGNPGYVQLADSNVEGALNATQPTKANMIGASDGTKLQALQVDAIKNLKVSLRSSGGVEPVMGVQGDGDPNSRNILMTGSRGALFNESTWDNRRGNTQGTLLVSAARTVTIPSADQTNFNSSCLHVVVDITAAGTGSITVNIEAKDPTSGKYYPILTSANLTANGTTVLKVGKGLTAVANLVANDFVPRTWRTNVIANNVNPVTYSLGKGENIA